MGNHIRNDGEIDAPIAVRQSYRLGFGENVRSKKRAHAALGHKIDPPAQQPFHFIDHREVVTKATIRRQLDE